MSTKSSIRPHPPSVDRVLARLRDRLDGARDADALLAVARDVVEEERNRLAAGHQAADLEALATAALTRLDGFADAGPPAVINGTGVIVHTNLGRAPWPAPVAHSATNLAASYLLLELDRETGRRGARARIAEDHLVALTGAEDALVTNNNAAALALAVGLVRRAGVAVSRGELVEIGGGVRIPEIVRRAGARLIEVGTTNRTRTADFEDALADGRARAVLRVHPSNFTMAGFTEAPDPRELADLAHRHGAIVIDDLGSGALLDTAAYGLAHEPTPTERLAAGADLVAFSGDKLVGGPQAGLVVGRSDLIARMRRDPLARAMRPDKVTMAGVALTLGLYRAGRATRDIPVWRMIATPLAELRDRAADLVADLVDDDTVDVVELRSTVGGGSLPGETVASAGVAVGTGAATRLLAALRRGDPPVIARIEGDRVVIDLRTVDPAALGELARAIERARQAVG
jgi:L-seryl-tRNA(Ser) seleniumtransferase